MSDSWNWEALLEAEPPARPRDTLDDAVAAVLAVRERDALPMGEATGTRWLGALRVPADEALAALRPRFARDGFTALIQQAEAGSVAVVAVPGVVQPGRSRLWLALLLFGLTVVSTIITGAGEPGPGDSIRWNWAAGLMYSAALLAILLAHELGHFLMARRLGVVASYPFFIPLPFVGIFGTMGAVIQMKEPPPDRRALFSIGVAGPLAGLVLAIPLTLFGLSLSNLQPLPELGPYWLEGNSLLYAALKWLVFGRWLPGGGEDVLLHPIAWAGWAGMLVTALNLLPAGQLDGGHVVFGLLGRRWSGLVTRGVVVALAALGFVWNGWWLWAVLILLIAGRPAPVLNDVTPLSPRQRLVALLTLVIFALIFTPTPLVLVPPG